MKRAAKGKPEFKGKGKERKQPPEVAKIQNEISQLKTERQNTSDLLLEKQKKVFNLSNMIAKLKTSCIERKAALKKHYETIEKAKKQLSTDSKNNDFEEKKNQAKSKFQAKAAEMKEIVRFTVEKSVDDTAMNFLDAIDKRKTTLNERLASGELEPREERNITKIIEKLESSRILAIEYQDAFKEFKSFSVDPKKKLIEYNEFIISNTYELIDKILESQQICINKIEALSKELNEELENFKSLQEKHSKIIKDLNALHLNKEKTIYEVNKRNAAEAKKREEAALERQKNYEAEKALFDNKSPYEDEIRACNELITYLIPYIPKEENKEEKTEKKEEIKEEKKEEGKKSNVKEATILVQKKPIQEVKKKQKKRTQKKDDRLVLGVQVFAKFDLVGVSCPMLASEVTSAIEELKKRKQALIEKSQNEKKEVNEAKEEAKEETKEVKEEAKEETKEEAKEETKEEESA